MSVTSLEASTVEAIVRGILSAYLDFLSTSFDLPFFGRAPYYLYLSILLWLGTILLVFAKAIAILVSIGRRN